MKIATARQRIGAIRRAAKSGDDETAHRLEDAFRAGRVCDTVRAADSIRPAKAKAKKTTR